MCFPLLVTCYQKEFLFCASTMGFFWIPYLWTKRHFYKNLFEIPAFSDLIFWFHDEIFEIFFFSCSALFWSEDGIFHFNIGHAISHATSSPSHYLFELRAILGFSQGIHMPVSHSAYYTTWKSCKTLYNSSGNPISIGKATSQASCPLTLLVSRAWQRQELHF